ncbi:MAG: hypothetical protein JO061_18720 [Acidobacteriaceae bacterium]|nr:hypothetical protein [Acidobacteriaceae bacterium]
MRLSAAVIALSSLACMVAQSATPDVQDIIKKSVEANQRDYEADPKYNYKERDRDGNQTKTYQITMIEGTPYQRLIAINGKPLPKDQADAEMKKQEQAAEQRKSESAADRQKRIQKFQRDRERDHNMMDQLTVAFNFTLVGQHRVRGYSVWALKATPKPGYNPPNRDTQVLTGMQGELWINQKNYQWVRVTAEVMHPVSIEGFLARVEPGTRFELTKAPVGDGSVWLAAHFTERASAKVLGVFSHHEQEDNTFFDYELAKQ